ncbi:hypothetical protein R3X27_17975 [Tropicimonas sp. TH_r6]|uniref:hypothetical protein n=1 Tax=Tropicimonas sp. TH_r6 TaxID=3082085 RepID=UPI0029559BD5|nr:hypothetical protein [Tropicimonas sp. TH_r6]MDV7144570.1 hypothetical protein [Tropicimonas sp. TH_r6]
MGVWQRLLRRITPDPAALEAETRKWWITCKTCGNSQNLWEAGGVRYKAKGTKTSYGHCSHCGRKRWLRIHKKD